MLSWFRPPPHPHMCEDASVWLSDAARLKGVVVQAQQRLVAGEKVVLGTHSTATVQALRNARGSVPVEVLEPHQLSPSRLTEQARGAKALRLLLVGPALQPAWEENLLVQCKALPFRISLQVHYTLPELGAFGVKTEPLQGLLKTLGLGEDEAIVHKFVSRAIANARKKAR